MTDPGRPPVNFATVARANSGEYTTLRENVATCTFVGDGAVGEVAECPVRAQCDGAVDQLLASTFSLDFTVSASEATSCPVVRGEVTFHKSTDFRISVRKHIHEVIDDGHRTIDVTDDMLQAVLQWHREIKGVSIPENVVRDLRSLLGQYASTEDFRIRYRHVLESVSDSFDSCVYRLGMHALHPMRCRELNRTVSIGRYLGFVDVRFGALSSIALAVIAPPRRFCHASDVRLLLGDFGPYFGGASFQSTVYSSHDPNISGAQCAQTCVLMAVSMLSDRHVSFCA